MNQSVSQRGGRGNRGIRIQFVDQNIKRVILHDRIVVESTDIKVVLEIIASFVVFCGIESCTVWYV